MTRRQLILALAAIALVPILFACYVALSYRIALKAGRLPITNEPEWIWWSVLFGLVVLGCYLAWTAAPRLKAMFAGIYLIAMTVSLLAVHYWVACMNGDCL